MTAREAALKALAAFENGQSPEAAVDGFRLEPREAALARRICACVLTNRLLIDLWIGKHVGRPLEKLQQRLLDALRLTAAQIAWFDRVPNSAAVNEGVKLVRTYVNSGAAKLANAVMRRMAEDGRPPKPKGADAASVEFSCPVELYQYYVNNYGAETALGIAKAQNELPPVYARVNTLKTTPEALIERLAGEGAQAKAHPWLPGTFEVGLSGSVEALAAFREGLFFVQDPAATLAVLAAAPSPGMRLLDACASPGGKSFAAALEMRGEGSIVSRDISEKKLRPIIEGAQRLEVDIIHTEARDASKNAPGEGFDIVLADAPCSGFGTVRKKPEIRYKPLASVAALPEKQLAILNNLAGAVKPGGVLLYSTCTLIREENEGVTDAFLAGRPDFEPEAFSLPGAGRCDGRVTLLPGKLGTDGFYICKMRRKKI
jgi:16S rRNA (cytosine967-C5)-methyltransferase